MSKGYLMSVRRLRDVTIVRECIRLSTMIVVTKYKAYFSDNKGGWGLLCSTRFGWRTRRHFTQFGTGAPTIVYSEQEMQARYRKLQGIL